ncbi:MAG: hypothetical protein ACTSPQ_19960 [Candidatus Helarchaeota archaeon]
MSIKTDILEEFLNKLKKEKSIPLDLVEFIRVLFERERIVKINELKEKLEDIVNNEFSNKEN